MEKRSNEAIIRQLKSGKEQEAEAALTYLYQVSKITVSRFILRNKGNKQDVDDIFHDGLIAFYKLVKQDKIKPDTNVEAYLYSICRNMWVKKLMKGPKEIELTESYNWIATEETQIHTILEGERKILIDKLLDGLGEECKKVLVLYYYERMKMKEIVVQMHYANDQVVRNKKAKCMKKLKTVVLESPLYKDLLMK